MSARAHRSPIDGFTRLRPLRRRRSARGWTVGLPALLITALAAALSAGLFPGFLSIFSRVPNAASQTEIALSWRDRIAVAVGLKVTRVEIRGQHYTQLPEVEAALALDTIASQASFDLDAARRRVEALPWVRRAKLYRILPDGVGVEITERTGAIVWRGPDRDVLIDIDGRELSTLPRGSDLGLPVVTGDGAGPTAPGLVALVRSHPEIERRVVDARRIEDRRWTLRLASGTLLHLPGDGAAAALAWIEAHTASGLLDRGLEAIDLRVPGQLVIRAGGGKFAEPAALPRRNAGIAVRESSRATAAGGPP